jgi:RND family efflux transporter MFP subunit
VQATQPIFIIQASDRIRVSIDVPESFVLSLEGSIEERRETAETAKTEMYFTGYPDRLFDLTFEEVATAPDPETLTWSVRFEMPAPPDLIVLPGMSCYVRTFNEGRRYTQAGIRIPLSALTQGSESGTGAVWVVDPSTQKVAKRDVEFGDIRDDSVSVTTGLSEGEVVVRAGINDLVDGKQVRLLEDR